MAKILATNGIFQLVYTPEKVHCFSVYRLDTPHFKQELARSSKLTKKLSSFFTSEQLRTAKARVHAVKRVTKTFGF